MLLVSLLLAGNLVTYRLIYHGELISRLSVTYPCNEDRLPRYSRHGIRKVNKFYLSLSHPKTDTLSSFLPFVSSTFFFWCLFLFALKIHSHSVSVTVTFSSLCSSYITVNLSVCVVSDPLQTSSSESHASKLLALFFILCVHIISLAGFPEYLLSNTFPFWPVIFSCWAPATITTKSQIRNHNSNACHGE